MNKEIIIKNIAEECGIIDADQFGPLYKTDNGWVMDCPDYLNDLNAIVNEVRALPQKRIAKTLDFLKIIVTNDPSNLSNEQALATPQQWSEAFLRTVGRWEE